MNVKELDSFYFKFKNLLFAEKDANFVINQADRNGVLNSENISVM